MGHDPLKKTGEGDQPLVDGRRGGFLDGLLVCFPVFHIAGDDAVGGEGFVPKGGLAPMDEMLHAALVSRAGGGAGNRAGGRHRGHDVWRCRRVWADAHFRLFGCSSQLGRVGGRAFSVLSGGAHFF